MTTRLFRFLSNASAGVCLSLAALAVLAAPSQSARADTGDTGTVGYCSSICAVLCTSNGNGGCMGRCAGDFFCDNACGCRRVANCDQCR